MKFSGGENFIRLAPRRYVGAVGFLLCLGSLFGGDEVAAATNLNNWPPGGVFTAAGSPYLVNVDALTVAAGTTVTIDPGVIIKMKTGLAFPVQFNILGRLIANGTAEAPIIITSYKDDVYGGDTNNDGADSSPAVGDWHRIIAAQSGATVQLSYTTLRYGGSGSWGALTLFSGGIGTVSHSTIEYAGFGIYVYGSGSELYLSDSIIRRNGFGIYDYIGGKSDIARSVINNNSTGLRFSDTAASQLSVAASSIYGNTSKGLNYTFGTGTLDVRNNWWGSTTGPTIAGNPGGTGDVVAGDVSFSPWTTQDPANQPPTLSYVATSGYVDDGVEPNTTFKNSTLPVFKVLYADAEGTAPSYINLIVASSTSATYALATSTGGVYEYLTSTSTFAKASYTYHFEASDGVAAVRFPAVGELSFAVKNIPVILVPGIMGTELDGGGLNLWANLDRMLFWPSDDFMNPLAMDDNGNPSDTSVHITDVIRKKEAVTVTTFDYFDGLINALESSGYYEDVDLFVFPYDWRIDIKTSSNILKGKINLVKNQTNSSKVDIIAHSMGGLLSKQYILDNGSSSVNKLIFIGTPHLGSPKSTKTLLFGDNLGMEVPFPFLNPDRVKYIAKNMPSIYELLPSRAFINQNGRYYFDESQKILFDFTQTTKFLEDSGLNSILLQNADNFHSNALDNFNISAIDAYNINGCNTPTITNIIKRNTNEYFVSLYEGDGTVPLISSRAIDTATDKTYYFKDIDHAKMPSMVGIRNLITQIINGISTTLPSNATQNLSLCHIEGKMVSVHSPVNLHIYDSSGNHVGRGENGTIDYNISGVAYEEIGENKFVFLPTSGGQTYQIELDGTGEGTYSLRVSRIEDNAVVETAYYSDLPVNTATEATVTLASSVANTVLQVDQNGTGSFSPVSISAVLDSTEATDTTQPGSTISVVGGQTSATVSLAGTDDNAGVLKIEYSLNNGSTWNTYSNSFIITTIGDTTLQYRATDRAGNVESTKSRVVTVTAAPNAVIPLPASAAPAPVAPQVLGEEIQRPKNETYTKDQILDSLTLGDPTVLLDYLGQTPDADLETKVTQDYKKYLALDKAAINFIAYGTKSTAKLGRGERANVLRSYQYAFGKLPQTPADWQDAVNIAAGQLPVKRNTKVEQEARAMVRKIYGKVDERPVLFIAYGLRPAVRDMNKEQKGLSRFGKIFGRLPSSVFDWNIFRKLVY